MPGIPIWTAGPMFARKPMGCTTPCLPVSMPASVQANAYARNDHRFAPAAG
jgi:hypothetical protein